MTFCEGGRELLAMRERRDDCLFCGGRGMDDKGRNYLCLHC